MSSFSSAALILVCLATALPSAALGDPPVSNPVYRSLESGKAAHDAGIVRGVLEQVDYSGGLIYVRTHGREIVVVAIVPSTGIYEGRQYATFSDLRPGRPVEMSIYEVDGRLVAQTIRLK